MKIDHVAIWCKNLETMRAYYTRHFGCKCNTKYANKEKGFESYFLTLGEDGCRIELMHRTDLTAHHNECGEYIGMAHLCFDVGGKKEVDQLTEQLRSEGYTIAGNARTTGDGYYESVALDPEGNRVELSGGKTK
jgi:lactoylglutathione lyase